MRLRPQPFCPAGLLTEQQMTEPVFEQIVTEPREWMHRSSTLRAGAGRGKMMAPDKRELERPIFGVQVRAARRPPLAVPADGTPNWRQHSRQTRWRECRRPSAGEFAQRRSRRRPRRVTF